MMLRSFNAISWFVQPTCLRSLLFCTVFLVGSCCLLQTAEELAQMTAKATAREVEEADDGW